MLEQRRGSCWPRIKPGKNLCIHYSSFDLFHLSFYSLYSAHTVMKNIILGESSREFALKDNAHIHTKYLIIQSASSGQPGFLLWSCFLTVSATTWKKVCAIFSLLSLCILRERISERAGFRAVREFLLCLYSFGRSLRSTSANKDKFYFFFVSF